MTTLETSVQGAPPSPPRRRRLWRGVALLLGVAVVGLVLVTRLEGQPPARSVLVSTPAPALQGPALDGGSFDLADWRGDVVVHTMVQTPTKLDAAQEDLLRQLATARGEERPEGRLANPAEGSIFGKLRDAFKAR